MDTQQTVWLQLFLLDRLLSRKIFSPISSRDVTLSRYKPNDFDKERLVAKVLGYFDRKRRHSKSFRDISHFDALPAAGKVQAAASIKDNVGNSKSKTRNAMDCFRRGFRKSLAGFAFSCRVVEIGMALFC